VIASLQESVTLTSTRHCLSALDDQSMFSTLVCDDLHSANSTGRAELAFTT